MKKLCFLLLFFPLLAKSQTASDWKTLNKQVDSLMNIRMYLEAIPLCEQAIEAAEKEFGKNNANWLWSRNDLGACLGFEGEREKTERILLENLELTKKFGEKSKLYESALGNAGCFYSPYYKGNIAKESEKYLKLALALSKELYGEKSAEYANHLNNLAITYDALGYYEEAEKLYKESIKLSLETTGENDANYTIGLFNLADLYVQMGNYSGAEPLYHETLRLQKETMGENHPDYGNTLCNFADMYYGIGNYGKAEQLYKEALKILKASVGEENFNYSTTLGGLANLYWMMGNYKAAQIAYEEALKNIKSSLGNKHFYYGIALSGYADLSRDKGNYTAAMDIYKEALLMRKELLGEKHQQYTESLFGLAYLYQMTNKQKEAKDLYLSIIKAKEGQILQNFPSLSEREKTDFFNNTSKHYFDNFNAFVINHWIQKNKKANVFDDNLLGELYDLQLFSKALLLQSSQRMKNRIFDSKDTVLIGEFEKWTELRHQLATYQQMSKAELEAEEINLDSLENESNNIEKSLSLRSLAFAKLTDKQINTWRDIQGKLKNDEVAIEIVRINKFGIKQVKTDTTDFEKAPHFPKYNVLGLTDSIYYAALIVKKKAKQPEIVLLSNGNELENEKINFYRNAVRYNVRDTLSFAAFWKPIQQHLKGVKKVYLSPDGVYNQLNVNTLFDTELQKYLQENIEIHQLTNTKDILAFSENNNTKISPNSHFEAVLFGRPAYNMDSVQFAKNPKVEKSENFSGTRGMRALKKGEFSDLLGTEKEIKQIDSLLQSKSFSTTKYLGSQATEEQIKKLQNPKILHIATHGFFIADATQKNSMLHSGILLAGVTNYIRAEQRPDTEDGILTAFEAQNMNLENTDLVVLSACETGLGNIRSGEGVYGLQRAFKVAGAKSILMSLWKVDDRVTQELMTAFYANYIKTNDKRKSFEMAQAQIRAQYPSPFYWGAFILVGE